MTSTQKTIAIIVAVFAAIFLAVYVVSKLSPQKYGDIIQNTYYSAESATSTMCYNGVSSLLAATSTNGRPFMRITNIGSAAIYLGLGVPARVYNGLSITASSSFEMNQTNNFSGAIYCAGQGANASTSVIEATQ